MRAPPSHQIVAAGTALGVAAAALLLAGCDRKDPGRVPGYVEAEFVYVAPVLSGTLEKLSVKRGDQISQGAPLFRLEHEAEAAAQREASQRLEKARAALAKAESDDARAEKLFVDKVISPEEIDAVRKAAREWTAEVAAAEASLRQSQWQLDQRTVAAPITALVQDTLYREGEWVGAGKPVVSLLPPGNLKVRFFLGEAQLTAIRHGMNLRIATDGGATIDAPVTYIAPQAEYTPPVIFSRDQRRKLVFMVELSIPAAAANHLHPGLPVDVWIPTQGP
ncbi:MAG TPA: efflux RND transporter periplasmic adaptor subunit [Verrucomicrobiae bacterium]|nr:efflux RND transporter periplasmic adaptor subunit [Verrucomicrobiae bacterium]